MFLKLGFFAKNNNNKDYKLHIKLWRSKKPKCNKKLSFIMIRVKCIL